LDKAVAILGSGVAGVQGDVSNLDDLDRLFATVQAEKGHVDVLFANAGIGTLSRLGAITEEQFDKVFDVNVKGTLFTACADAAWRLHYPHRIDYWFHGNTRLQRVQRNQGGYP
jgi:NAD(P)-dependent dehydrogenase (short-subunit alcohol dehydrogenase family)